jgi:hypothetical protein
MYSATQTVGFFLNLFKNGGLPDLFCVFPNLQFAPFQPRTFLSLPLYPFIIDQTPIYVSSVAYFTLHHLQVIDRPIKC